MVNAKSVSLGETNIEKLLIVSVSKVRHRSVQNTPNLTAKKKNHKNFNLKQLKII
jgi:hypothetical protein